MIQNHEELRQETIDFWRGYCKRQRIDQAVQNAGVAIINAEEDGSYWNTRSMATLWERAHLACKGAIH